MSKPTRSEKAAPAVGFQFERSVRPRGAMRDYVAQNWKREANYVAEIENLRAWIKHIGLSADICTRNALGEVCENCRCKHAPKGPNVRGKPGPKAEQEQA